MIRTGCLILIMASALPAQSWDNLVDRYFEQAVFRFNPSTATTSGFHHHDAEIEDFSTQTNDEQRKTLHRFEQEITAFRGDAPDRELLLANIHSTLLALDSIRMWEKNPDMYSSAASSAAFVIMSRKFAPVDSRLASMVSRERLMPRLFAEARVNLKNPPKVYTEVAIDQLPGIVEFFRNDVPLAFRDSKNQALLAEFHKANDTVIKELQSYLAWLKSDLLPRSKGDFRLGRDNYSKKLLYDEMVDIPLDRLLDIGYKDLRRNQQAFRDTAKKIDPSKTPQQILEAAEKDHPSGSQLLKSFSDTLEGLRAFIIQRHLVTIPSTAFPIVEETPPFMRALTSASMDMPGPYEKVAKDAFFNVTLPDKTLKPAEVRRLP